jgi:hypothetical protein
MKVEKNYLNDVSNQFERYKNLAEKAMKQISDEQLFIKLDSESNSVAIMVKHLAGNLRSRWTHLLTSDGEKPDRHRDQEFEIFESDSKQLLNTHWNDSWKILFGTFERLEENDLERIITIRGENHTLVEAINKQLTHLAYHVGQIVFLAKHLAGKNFQSLSIPKGRSENFLPPTLRR